MTVALKIGICHLLLEFATDAFCILRALHSAGAISTLHFEPLTNSLDYFLVFVKPDSHYLLLFSLFLREWKAPPCYILPQSSLFFKYFTKIARKCIGWKILCVEKRGIFMYNLTVLAKLRQKNTLSTQNSVSAHSF